MDNSERERPGSTAFQGDRAAEVDGFWKKVSPARNRLPSDALQSEACNERVRRPAGRSFASGRAVVTACLEAECAPHVDPTLDRMQ